MVTFGDKRIIILPARGGKPGGGQWPLGYSIKGFGDEQRHHPTKVTRCSRDAVDRGGTGHGVRLAPRTAFDERMFRGDQAYARN